MVHEKAETRRYSATPIRFQVGQKSTRHYLFNKKSKFILLRGHIQSHNAHRDNEKALTISRTGGFRGKLRL